MLEPRRCAEPPLSTPVVKTMSEQTGVGLTTQLQRRTTSDDIVHALREAIAKGRFRDGEELNQVTLARDFGVSRVPVREALRQLQAEGLVSSQPHMRTVVLGLSLERVLEALDLRLMLETYLIERVAANLTEDDIDELRRHCDEMDGVTDHLEWLRRNRNFHELLYSHAHTDLALELSRQLSVRVERFLHMRRDTGVQRTEEANAEHRRIVEALAARDTARARAELEQHIGHTRERVVQLFEEQTLLEGTA